MVGTTYGRDLSDTKRLGHLARAPPRDRGTGEDRRAFQGPIPAGPGKRLSQGLWQKGRWFLVGTSTVTEVWDGVTC